MKRRFFFLSNLACDPHTSGNKSISIVAHTDLSNITWSVKQFKTLAAIQFKNMVTVERSNMLEFLGYQKAGKMRLEHSPDSWTKR